MEVDEESGKTTYSLTIESQQKVKVDYLFVVDNSNSMNAIISQMQDGFKEIAEKGEFPETARVAVISTAVDEVKNEGAKLTGFKKPVDKASIALSERSDKEEKPGCNKGWFKPTDKDANDNYCLTSHTSFKLYGTNAEAGLTAFNNYLDSQADKAFRKDALVNVVFFSDTHDVGAGKKNAAYPALKEKLDSYSLEGFIEKAGEISSLKFHGLVPQEGEEQCSNENDFLEEGYAYNKFIDASGGQKVHCSGSDYAGFISAMVESSKTGNKIFYLPKDFSGTIERVLIEDKEYEFDYDKDKNSILVKAIPSTLSGKIELKVVTK